MGMGEREHARNLNKTADLSAIRGEKETTMKLTIKWRYPNEIAPMMHTKTYYDINPFSIKVANDVLSFAERATAENPFPRDWNYPVSHVVEMNLKEE